LLLTLPTTRPAAPSPIDCFSLFFLYMLTNPPHDDAADEAIEAEAMQSAFMP
jgi:hypothetical protein